MTRGRESTIFGKGIDSRRKSVCVCVCVCIGIGAMSAEQHVSGWKAARDLNEQSIRECTVTDM